MSRHTKLNILSFLVIGILITWGKYTIVIGQTTVKPVLVALNKADNTLAIIEPGEMKVLGKVATGDSPHEVVLSADGKTAYVANYGAQTPGSSISMIDTVTMKETRRVDVSPLRRPHGLKEIGGKLYFTSETNRIIARYDPAANKIDWMMGTGQNGSHMVVATADQKRFYTANIGSDSVTAFEFQAIPPAPSKITHIPVGKQPEAIDVSPDGKEVWVGLNAEGGIDIVDTATNKVIERVKLGERPYRVMFTPDGKQVFCHDAEHKRDRRDRRRDQERAAADEAGNSADRDNVLEERKICFCHGRAAGRGVKDRSGKVRGRGPGGFRQRAGRHRRGGFIKKVSS